MNQNIVRGIQSVRAESSAPSATDTKAAIDTLAKTFADFKKVHAQELDAIKANVSTALEQAKLEKVNADLDAQQKAVDDINMRLAAMDMNGAGAGDKVKDKEYTDSFKAHMRMGDKAGDVVLAALNKGVDGEGGYLTPVEWDRTITDKLKEVSPMRQFASVINISKTGFSKLYNMGGTNSGWVGETDARPATDSATFKPLAFSSGEIYANVPATQQILDDAEINLETFIADEVQSEFALQEGKAFISGTGANMPSGILTYVAGAANAAKHPFGAIKVISSGDDNEIKSNAIIDVIYDLPSAFTANSRFALNRKSLGVLRKLKDGQGNYLWQPSYMAGQPSTLAGFPVAEFPDMPDVAADAIPLLFGDFQRTYLVIDRIGVRVLRDPYTNKPYVMFYITKRVGGGLLNPEPMRAMKVAA